MVVEANFLKSSKKNISKDRVMDMVRQSNEFAFSIFSQHFLSLVAPMDKDMQLVPVIISMIAHDWIKSEYELDSIDFKSTFFLHKIQEEPDYIDFMRGLQYDMMVMAAQVSDVMNSAMSGAGTRAGNVRVNDAKS